MFSLKWQNIKSQKTPSVGEKVLRPALSRGESVRLYQRLGKLFGSFSSGYTEIYPGAQFHANLLTQETERVALFKIAPNWKQPKQPSAFEWISELLSIHTMEYCWAVNRNDGLESVAMWINLENIC